MDIHTQQQGTEKKANALIDSSVTMTSWKKKQLLKPFGSNEIYEDQQGNVFGCTSIPQS